MSEYKDSRGRGTKRKVENGGGNGKKNRGELSCPPLPPNGYPKAGLPDQSKIMPSDFGLA